MRLGFRSAAAAPADTGDGAQLAINLYGRELDAFGEPEMRRARSTSTRPRVRSVCACCWLSRPSGREHLQSAMASRSTIDQALGVIMGQNRISRDEAFAILRAASQHRNVKLREVAATLIENLTGHAGGRSRREFGSAGR